MFRTVRHVGVLLIALLVIGCSSEEKSGTIFKVSVAGEFPDGGKVVLFAFSEEGFGPLDTLEAVSPTQFELQIPIEEAGFYRIDVARLNFMNMVLDGSEELVDIKFTQQGRTIEGSEASLTVYEVDEHIEGLQERTKELNQEGAKAIQLADSSALRKVQEEYLGLTKKYNDGLKDIINRSNNSFASLYALNYLDLESNLEVFEGVVDKAKGEIGEHFWVDELVKNIESVKVLAIGMEAPNFSLPSPDGENISLSDLRGKYVLIDFWAAWCRPCRVENPNVVKLYEKYGGENFEILGVSLDRTKDAWVKAIADDGLPWLHVSDLKYYDSEAARIYNISAIPATYLIDPEGKIAAKNLRGETLHAKLAEIFIES